MSFDANSSKILKASLDIFGAEGFVNVTMTELAKAAEMSVPTLYKSFASKDEIFHSLVSTLIVNHESVLEIKLPSGLSNRQKLEMLCIQQHEWLFQNEKMLVFIAKNLNRILSNSESSQDPRIMGMKRLEEWFSKNIELPNDCGFNNRVLARAFWGTMHALFLEALHSGNYDDFVESRPHILNLFMQGIGASLK